MSAKKSKKITMNEIVGYYTNDGDFVFPGTGKYDYVQIQLMGNHADNVENYEDNIMLISKKDIHIVMNFKWYLGKSGYPVTYGSIDNEYKFIPPISCHRFLNPNIDKGYVVDHINRNRLDNRRVNYRIITQKQNSYNRTKSKNSSNKYKGVKKYKKSFSAIISKDGVRTEIRGFKTEEEAAQMYDMMAEDLFGQYAGKNFENETY
jgi:hypothetical protein